MRKIYKFNQYLLEKYPTIWNTKIVWMLLVSVLVHILFFIIGYLSHADPRSLQVHDVKDDYFKSGVIFIHLIISILMIVGWLIMMFKNNAFKNFYPTSKSKLFFQFVQYFIIVFASTTFFFSYMIGFRLFINNKYPDKETAKKIELINKAYPFIAQEIELYTLDNKLYPKIFSDLFCETNLNDIDQNKKYFTYYDRVYQYYSIYSKKSSRKDKYGNFIAPEPEYTNKIPIAYWGEEKDGYQVFYFKKDVVDLTKEIETTRLSYKNFSTLLYELSPENTSLAYNLGLKRAETIPDGVRAVNNLDPLNKEKRAEINKNTIDLLNRNNPAELEKLISEFLNISKEYDIKNNLTGKVVADMVFVPQNPNFEVKHFIKRMPDSENIYGEADEMAAVEVTSDGYTDTLRAETFNPDMRKELSPEKYYRQHLTKYYYNSDDLKYFLSNIDSVKSRNLFAENIHIYFWIAFFLSAFIFSFRITGLRPVLFTVIGSGVLVLAVTLIAVLYNYLIDVYSEFFTVYLIFIISLIILLIPLLMMKRVGKLVSAIFVNISMIGFVLVVFLIFGIINLHQLESCKQLNNKYLDSQRCFYIIEYLGLYLSYILLICGFIFMYFYTSVIQKWKAMPE